MKRSISLFILLTIGLSTTFAQGINFFSGNWEEALKEAQRQEKIIFVDAYAVWCGPCKRMSKNVFPNDKVGSFFNKNFISLKLDMERGEGLKFRQKYPVSAFPTLFFIDGNGKVIHQVKGARDVDGFIQLGKKALSKVDYSKDYEIAYKEGNREPEFVYKYVKALIKSGKPSSKVVNEYLRNQKDFGSEANLKFLLAAVTEVDSKCFDLFAKHKKEIIQLSSLEEFQAKVQLACQNTANKAIEFESQDLLKQANTAMKKHYPAKANSFALLQEMNFCLALKDVNQYLQACKEFARKEAKGDAEQLHTMANTIVKAFGRDIKAMKQAEQYAKTAALSGNAYNYYFTYANILLQNGKKTEALDAANQSLKLAKESAPRAVRSIVSFINSLES